MSVVGLLLATGLFYGVASYVEKDNNDALTAETSKPAVAESPTLTEDTLLTASTTLSSTTTSPTSATTTVKYSKKIPFAEFMSKGGSYTCDITQTMANMTSTGKVYIHNGQVRVELAISLAGQSMTTTMVSRDGYMYTWTSSSPTKGYKTKIVDANAQTNGTSTASTYTWNGSQVGDYTCTPWTVDSSMFDLPKTVTFTVQ